jgi:TM2 domain-containing membrane protein YozV
MEWLASVQAALAINWGQFLQQAIAMAAWICVAAAVYSVVERTIGRLDPHRLAVLTAYVIWLLFGLAGGHRIYFGRIGTGLVQLALTTALVLTGLLTGVGMLLVVPVAVWVVIDAFLIPGWIRAGDSMLAASSGAGAG